MGPFALLPPALLQCAQARLKSSLIFIAVEIAKGSS